MGLSFGDGGLTYRKNSNKKRFQLRGHLVEDKEHYDNYIIPLFNKEIMFPVFNRGVCTVFNKTKNFYGISVEGTRIEGPLNFIGIPTGKKEELYIPKWIKNNKNYSTKFLRGFLDTDGCVSCQRNYSIKNNKYHTQIRIYLGCCSKNLMTEINDLLRLLGFKCLIRAKNSKTGYGTKTLYEVKICGGVQINKWFEEIGSKNPKHSTKYLIWKEFGFCPPHTSLEDRKRMLKKEVSPHDLYAEMPERSNGVA